jgi:hypothetical protein
MTQGKKENLLDYIKRIGSKAYAQEATDVKIKSQQRRDFKKTGQYYFNITPGLKKGKAVKVKKPKFDDDVYEDDKHPEYEGDPVMPIGPFKKKKMMSVKHGGFAPNTEYTGSFIDGRFDDLNISNKSYLKYYKELLK